MQSHGHQPGNMRDIRHDHRPDFVGHGAELVKINRSRIGTGSDHNHLRFVFPGNLGEFVIIDGFRVAVYAVGNDFVKLAGKVSGLP